MARLTIVHLLVWLLLQQSGSFAFVRPYPQVRRPIERRHDGAAGAGDSAERSTSLIHKSVSRESFGEASSSSSSSTLDNPIGTASLPATSVLLGSKVRIRRTDAGSLEIDIPRRSIREVGLLGAGFTVGFLGFTSNFSVNLLKARAGLLTPLISYPLWYAGAKMAQHSLLDPKTSTKVTIGIHSWSYERRLFRRKRRVEHPTWLLAGASIDLWKEKSQVTEPMKEAIRLRFGSNSIVFGKSLNDSEKEWIVASINEWLEEHREEILETAESIIA